MRRTQAWLEDRTRYLLVHQLMISFKFHFKDRIQTTISHQIKSWTRAMAHTSIIVDKKQLTDREDKAILTSYWEETSKDLSHIFFHQGILSMISQNQELEKTLWPTVLWQLVAPPITQLVQVRQKQFSKTRTSSINNHQSQTPSHTQRFLQSTSSSNRTPSSKLSNHLFLPSSPRRRTPMLQLHLSKYQKHSTQTISRTSRTSSIQ